jgi:hypothetical protein
MMSQLLLNPDAADEAPVAGTLTPYDMEHLATYARHLDAETDGVDWLEGADGILHICPYREPERAWLSWKSHMRRALWMKECGHHLLDEELELY